MLGGKTLVGTPLPGLALWIAFAACMTAAAPQPPLSSQSEAPALPSRGSPDQAGTSEWGGTTGGAADIAGRADDSNFWTVNLHWGRVLTSPHGPGPLRGTLEYAVEIVPAFVIKQSTTVYGGGFNPLRLQYNLVRNPRLVPFIQVGGGLLVTTQPVPENTSRLNFTPQGGIGIYWFHWPHTALALGVRYHHISDAGLTNSNPGHNSLYAYTGVSWWR